MYKNNIKVRCRGCTQHATRGGGYTHHLAEHNWFATNIWHCQYLASQHLAKSKVANIWQLFVRLATRIGKQPISSQYLAVAKIWHANFWHRTNYALSPQKWPLLCSCKGYRSVSWSSAVSKKNWSSVCSIGWLMTISWKS